MSMPFPGLAAGGFTTNSFAFTYANRQALLADGWSFLATGPSGEPRDTEVTSPGGTISYDQTAHPGVLRLPPNSGDLWGNMNSTSNNLLRNLPSNWVSLRLDVADFRPAASYQQVDLALYQDDDHYLEVGRGFNGTQGGQLALFAREDGGIQHSYSPQSLGHTNVADTSFQLRLDRDLATEAVTGLYSADGTNWIALGRSTHCLTNTRVCIWAGSSPTALPNCDLRGLEVVTTETPLNPILFTQPQQLYFNGIAGQTCTNVQQVRVLALRASAPLDFAVSKDASWLQVSTNAGNTTTPGFFDVSVKTASLKAGTYRGAVTCNASGATAAVVNVTLILNAATPVRLAPWKGAKAGAMTVWVDDSQPTAFEMLTTNGLAGSYMFWNEGQASIPFWAPDYYLAGMELGSHTVEHEHICRYGLNEPRARYNFETNIARICAGSPQPPNSLVTLAWPCGLSTTLTEAVAGDYFLAARGYNVNRLEDPTPYNSMNLKCFNGHEHAPYPPADLRTVVDSAVAQGSWFNMVLHSLANDDGAITYSRTKDIWVAPAGTVTKYIMQRDRTVITNYSKTTQTLRFNCYRHALEPSRVRSFETAIGTEDTLTFQVDLAAISAVSRVTVNGALIPFGSKVSAGKTNLLVNVPVTLTSQTVLLQISNSAPVLPTQPNQVAAETIPLVVTNTALDGDVPVQTMSYSLLNPPAGAQIDTNGVIYWTPGPTQAAASYTLRTKVSDPFQLSATNSFVVTVKRLLTVTADNQSRSFGAANPILTGTLVGVQAGDNITATYTTTATPSSPVGTYPVRPVLHDPQGRLANYSVITNNGILTVTPGTPFIFKSIRQQPDKQVELIGVGDPQGLYLLQAATNWGGWWTLSTNVADTNGVVIYLDPDATNSARRYYRTLAP